MCIDSLDHILPLGALPLTDIQDPQNKRVCPPLGQVSLVSCPSFSVIDFMLFSILYYSAGLTVGTAGTAGTAGFASLFFRSEPTVGNTGFASLVFPFP